MIPMICFGILRIFRETSQNTKNWKIWAYRAPTPQRREPTPRHRPTPRIGIPCLGEAEVPKLHPSGRRRPTPRRRPKPRRRPTPRRRPKPRRRPTPRRRYCSQRAIFEFLFPNTLYLYTDSLRTLINH